MSPIIGRAVTSIKPDKPLMDNLAAVYPQEFIGSKRFWAISYHENHTQKVGIRPKSICAMRPDKHRPRLSLVRRVKRFAGAPRCCVFRSLGRNFAEPYRWRSMT